MDISYTEPGTVRDEFFSGLAYIDDLKDGNHRFALFRSEGGINVVRRRIIMATPSIYTGMQHTMLHLGYGCCGGRRLAAVN